MKRNRILIALLIAIVGIILYNSIADGTESNEEYITRIAEARADKDLLFKTEKTSPIPAGDREKFVGLNYYPPNRNFEIVADLTPVENPEWVKLVTSDGKEKEYLTVAYAEFDLDNVINRVLLLQMEEPYENNLFLPFADLTSTNDTYGAGRYLEIPKTSKSRIVLDFNEAYNPYCAYSEEYSCPFPPLENVLNVAIEAGEKNYN